MQVGDGLARQRGGVHLGDAREAGYSGHAGGVDTGDPVVVVNDHGTDHRGAPATTGGVPSAPTGRAGSRTSNRVPPSQETSIVPPARRAIRWTRASPSPRRVPFADVLVE